MKKIIQLVAICVLGLATVTLSVLLIVNAGMNGYSPYGDTAANKLDAAAEYSAAAMMPKIADIGIQQISTEMNGSLFLESFKAVFDFFPCNYLGKLFVCDRFCCRINYAKTVLCTVKNHDMVNNLCRLVDTFVNGVRPMCEAGLEDGDNDNDRDKPSPRPDCRRNENKFICLFPEFFH